MEIVQTTPDYCYAKLPADGDMMVGYASEEIVPMEPRPAGVEGQG